MLSKAASSTIFWVFGMTRPRIEPWSPGSLANTLLIRPMTRLKIMSLPANPAHNCIFKICILLQSKRKGNNTFGLLMKTMLKESNIYHSIPLSPLPWLLKQPLVKLIKKNIHPLIYHENFFNIHKSYSNFSHISTDSSKNGNWIGWSTVYKNKIDKKCLLKEACIFTAEIFAIHLVLNFAATSSSKRFIIHSNSFSVLSSIKNQKIDNPVITNFLNT